jgi:hypothetical protein
MWNGLTQVRVKVDNADWAINLCDPTKQRQCDGVVSALRAE